MLITFWKGSFQSGDSWYHVAQAEHYLNQKHLVSENAFFPNQPAGTLYDFNSWHTFISAITYIGNFESVRFVWINLAAYFIALFLLSVYSFIRIGFREQYFPLFTIGFITLVNFIHNKFIFCNNIEILNV